MGAGGGYTLWKYTDDRHRRRNSSNRVSAVASLTRTKKKPKNNEERPLSFERVLMVFRHTAAA